MKIHEEIKKNKKLWELFTKKEEYNSTSLDEHGRIMYENCQHQDVLNPVVSKYLIEDGFQAEYPDGKKFAVVLTHDVDDIYVKSRHIMHSFLNFPKTGNILGIANLIRGKINPKKTPYNNFEKIIELEQKYDAESSFYFFSNPEDVFGKKYDINKIQDITSFILDKNCEIGLHTGYYSYTDIDKIRDEKKKIEEAIGEKITGVRNHVLRFKTPDTWNILSDVGFDYDTTFGYHDMVGFRNGMCHPFFPFNLNTNKKIDILEIPLNIQDWTLFWHMKTKKAERWDYIQSLIDTAERYNGVLNILWHNWTFSFPTSVGTLFNKDWTELYEKILSYCKKKNAWITSCKNIHEWHKKGNILKKCVE